MQRSALNKLLSTTPQLWKGRRRNQAQRSLSTGQVRLDAQLPGNGWPLGAITELISNKPGLGEFSLLFHALAELGQRGQWLMLVDPPWIPCPASLYGRGLPLDRLLLIRTNSEKESLWACEQALRGNHGGAVLAWPSKISFAHLRRLQLAAEENSKLAFLFRPAQAAHADSPAALRLQLKADSRQRTEVCVLKCRGNRPTEPIRIEPEVAFRRHNPLRGEATVPVIHASDRNNPGSLLHQEPLPPLSTAIN